MEMAKLKKDIRAAVVNYCDLITRTEEDKRKASPIKLSPETQKIKDALQESGRIELAPVISLIIGEPFRYEATNRVFVKHCLLVALDNKNGNVYFGVSPMLVTANGKVSGKMKEGIDGNNLDSQTKSSRYATREEIEDFFEYFPDPMMMDIFKDIPAEK